MELGIKGFAETIVTEKLTAKEMGSGDLPVLATPAMIALMERAANTSVMPFLENAYGTVGIYMEVSYMAPTTVNSRVEAKSLLIDIDKKILSFEVSAFCGLHDFQQIIPNAY